VHVCVICKLLQQLTAGLAQLGRSWYPIGDAAALHLGCWPV